MTLNKTNILTLCSILCIPISLAFIYHIYGVQIQKGHQLTTAEYKMNNYLYSATGVAFIVTYFLFLMDIFLFFHFSLIITIFFVRISTWVFTQITSTYFLTLMGLVMFLYPVIYFYAEKYFKVRLDDKTMDLIFNAVMLSRYLRPVAVLYFLLEDIPIWGDWKSFVSWYWYVLLVCFKISKYYYFLQEKAIPLAKEKKDSRIEEIMTGSVYTFRSVGIILLILAGFRVIDFSFCAIKPVGGPVAWYSYVYVLYIFAFAHIYLRSLLVIRLYFYGRLERKESLKFVLILGILLLIPFLLRVK